RQEQEQIDILRRQHQQRLRVRDRVGDQRRYSPSPADQRASQNPVTALSLQENATQQQPQAARIEDQNAQPMGKYLPLRSHQKTNRNDEDGNGDDREPSHAQPFFERAFRFFRWRRGYAGGGWRLHWTLYWSGRNWRNGCNRYMRCGWGRSRVEWRC